MNEGLNDAPRRARESIVPEQLVAGQQEQEVVAAKILQRIYRNWRRENAARNLQRIYRTLRLCDRLIDQCVGVEPLKCMDESRPSKFRAFRWNQSLFGDARVTCTTMSLVIDAALAHDFLGRIIASLEGVPSANGRMAWLRNALMTGGSALDFVQHTHRPIPAAVYNTLRVNRSSSRLFNFPDPSMYHMARRREIRRRLGRLDVRGIGFGYTFNREREIFQSAVRAVWNKLFPDIQIQR